MARQKPGIRVRTWGIYSQWDPQSKQLPGLLEVTTQIPARVDVEFGMVVNIRKAKNQQLDYCIDHPGILDDQGNRRAPFAGSVYVKSNDWDFFLGDTIWHPIEDKIGRWHLSLSLHGHTVAEKEFDIFAE